MTQHYNNEKYIDEFDLELLNAPQSQGSSFLVN